MSTEVVQDVRRLQAAYDEAQAESDLSETDYDYDQAEKAWNELVDFVEANDLNYTEHDPRGPGAA